MGPPMAPVTPAGVATQVLPTGSAPVPHPAAPHGPAAIPHTGPAIQPRLDASMSMPIAARRPWGLIVVVLLIDIGLAVAGSILLKQGLATASTGSAAPAAASGAPAAGTTTSQ